MPQKPPNYLEQFASAGADEMEGMAQGQAPKKKPMSRYEAAKQAQQAEWAKRRQAQQPPQGQQQSPAPRWGEYRQTMRQTDEMRRKHGGFAGASSGMYARNAKAQRERRSTGKHENRTRDEAMKAGGSTGYARGGTSRYTGGETGQKQYRGGGRAPVKRAPVKRAGGFGGGLGGGRRAAARRAAASGFRV
jgi:hypothetical protein